MIAAILMVRDEADIISYTLDHLLAEGIENILVADNGSIDGTREILDAYPVVVVDDPEFGYHQADKMTGLARQAHARFDADWILPCDADEWFYWTGGTLGEFFARCDVDVVTATGWDHLATAKDGDDPNPFKRITHRRTQPQKFGKVAYRWHPDARLDFGNHFVLDHPGRTAKALNYRHFQYRTFDQMFTKIRNGTRAADAAGLPETYAAHWRALNELSDDQLYEHWQILCNEPDLVDDPL